ncbi:hypothetical protein G6F57_020900 [Rhizopus arrhizus]|nr:hypothetical protein G6F57_020900 [Rhizopus arrhizus]
MAVADQLGMALPEPLPRAIAEPPKPEVEVSPTLSLTARPGDGGVATRKVAILVAEGVDGAAVSAVADALIKAGVVHVGRGRVAGHPPGGAVRWGHRPGRRGRRGALADGRAGAGIPGRRLPPRQDAAGVGGRHHAGAGDQALHRNHHDPRHGARR